MAFTLLSAASALAQATPTRIALNEGFARPESALFDAAHSQWLVSNIGGDQPGDGYISRMDAQGNIIEEQFIVGLDDPKGLGLHHGTLFIADVTNLVRVKLSAPDDLEVFPVEGAAFLNDVTVHPFNGDVYASDTLSNALYRLRGDTVTTLWIGSELEAPNGLSADVAGIFIVTIGPGLDPATFTTDAPGRVLRYDFLTQRLFPVSERFGALDGIVHVSGTHFLVSDFQVGVYSWHVGHSPELIIALDDTGLTANADIGLDARHEVLAIPDVFGSGVALYRLGRNRGK